MTKFEIQSGAAVLTGEEHGAGPAVVCLHAGVADRRMWAPQLAALGTTNRVVAYDRRGFGDTRLVDEPYSHVDDLLAVLDGLGIERATLLGCSQGGKIALDFALAHPQRVERLVLIAPAVGGAPAPETLPPAVEALLEALDEAETSGDVDRVNALEARIWLDGVLGEENRVGGEVRSLFLDMNGVALRAAPLGEERAPEPAWPRLGEIEAPTLVACGDLDFPHVFERSRALAERLPHARFQALPGTAHLPSLERPDVLPSLS